VTLTIEELLARQEITDVINKLARGTDRLDEPAMASCYHPDGFDDHNSFRGSGTDFARWVGEVLASFDQTMHFIGPPAIRVSGDVAQVDTYCIAHHLRHDRDLILALRYIDRFERRDTRWLIAKRVCAFDWTYTVAFNPADRFVFEADFTLGSRNTSDISYSGV
jgi:hypothetical protein